MLNMKKEEFPTFYIRVISITSKKKKKNMYLNNRPLSLFSLLRNKSIPDS